MKFRIDVPLLGTPQELQSGAAMNNESGAKSWSWKKIHCRHVVIPIEAGSAVSCIMPHCTQLKIDTAGNQSYFSNEKNSRREVPCFGNWLFSSEDL